MSLLSNRARLGLLSALVLVGAAVAGFHALFEKRIVEVDALPDGPARSDPYYALGKYLQERGIEVRTTRRWRQPPAYDTAVFWFNWEPVPLHVRDWLGDGGQLWAFTDPDGSMEWEPTPWREGEAKRAPDAQGEAATHADPWACAGDDYACWQRAQASRAIEHCGDDRVPCLYAAQFDYGRGCLTLVEEQTLTNTELVDGVNAARIDALLRCPEMPRAVVFVRGLEAPWVGELLARHAPEALLAALVLLLVSMWRAALYPGPPAPAPARARRRWMEHVGAVGRLAARTGLAPLVRGAREELRRRLSLRVPEASHLEGEALLFAVGGRLKVSEAAVQLALLEPPRGTPAHTLSIVRNMLELWRKL